jgi:hypothetical protein
LVQKRQRFLRPLPSFLRTIAVLASLLVNVGRAPNAETLN